MEAEFEANRPNQVWKGFMVYLPLVIAFIGCAGRKQYRLCRRRESLLEARCGDAGGVWRQLRQHQNEYSILGHFPGYAVAFLSEAL